MPSRILGKAGPLTDDERAELERHPEIGARIVGAAQPRTGGRVDPDPPRAPGRQRLPARPARPPDPARGEDPRGRRCLRRDDRGPAVPEGRSRPSAPWPSFRRGRAASSTTTWWRRFFRFRASSRSMPSPRTRRRRGPGSARFVRRAPPPAPRSSRAPRGWRASRGSRRAPAACPVRIRFTGTSSTLPLSVRGTSAIWKISSGTWRGEHCSRIRRLDLGLEALRRAWRRARGPRTGASIPRCPGAGRSTTSASRTCRDALHRAVDLAGPHPNALAVDGRVGAAVDHRRAARGDLDPVAVTPDARVLLEVARPVARAVVVPPEEQGHRRHRLGDHELAHLVDRPGCPSSSNASTAAPERTALELAAVDGEQRHAARRRPCRRRCPRRSRRARCRGRAGRRPTRSPPARAASRSSRRSEGGSGRGPLEGSTPAFMHAAM